MLTNLLKRVREWTLVCYFFLFVVCLFFAETPFCCTPIQLVKMRFEMALRCGGCQLWVLPTFQPHRIWERLKSSLCLFFFVTLFEMLYVFLLSVLDMMKTFAIIFSTTAPSHYCFPILGRNQTLSVAIDELDSIRSPHNHHKRFWFFCCCFRLVLLHGPPIPTVCSANGSVKVASWWGRGLLFCWEQLIFFKM